MADTSILKKLVKTLPKGSIYSLAEEASKVEVIPTGVSTLDFALGTGGFPRGHQVLLYGQSSSGKTALVLQTIGEWQKSHPDSVCAVIDLEKSMTAEWAKKFGINTDNLYIMRPTNVEEMISMTCEAVEAHVFDVIMVDSLGAGLLQSEIDNDKNRMGGSAGAITRMVKAINAAFISLEREIRVAKSQGEDTSEYVVPAVILINQVRADLKSMYGGVTYSGGYALTHMMQAIIRLRTSKAADDKIVGTVDNQPLRVGWLVSATVEKNKLATPGKSAGYTFIFRECPEHIFGIDNAQSIADLSLATGIAHIEGKTIYYPTKDGEEKVVGRKNFYSLLHEDSELVSYLAQYISQELGKDLNDSEDM